MVTSGPYSEVVVNSGLTAYSPSARLNKTFLILSVKPQSLKKIYKLMNSLAYNAKGGI